METLPQPESNELPPTREELVEALKNNPENLELFNKFLDARQKEIVDSGGDLALNVELAKIYRDAGLIEDAYEAFYQAYEQVTNEGEDELAQELLAEHKRLAAL